MAQAQKRFATIIGSDHNLTIAGTRYTGESVKNLPVSLGQSILASDGTVIFRFRENDQNGKSKTGKFKLRNGKSVRVDDLLGSIYCSLDVTDSYFTVVYDLASWFMKIGEDAPAYKQRIGKEIGGKFREETKDLLSDRMTRNVLENNDLEKLDSIKMATLPEGTTDSIVYYLTAGIFLEKNQYFKKANEKYIAAYLATMRQPVPSGVVKTVYKQFLYRMGRTKEGDAI